MILDDRKTYAPCNDVDIKYTRIGVEKQELVLVDSYMKGIDTLRKDAEDRDNFAVSDSFYPGIRLDISEMYTTSLILNFRGIIKNIFGLDIRRIKKAVSKYSIVTLDPEKLSLMQRIPHIDAPSRESLAVVHYLCDSPNSGTSLYRHRNTNFEYLDRSRLKNYLREIEGKFDKPSAYPSGYICGSTNEYEEIASYQAVRNRLLMYRGSSLHSGNIKPDYNFDPCPIKGRLTVTSFIEFS
ncbi:MAG: hypothetical protein ACI93R_002864 [Flavobacteriales bacterium]|jgi:hypothetical protein